MDVREIYDKMKPYKNQWLVYEEISKILNLPKCSQLSAKFNSLVRHQMLERKETFSYNKYVYKFK